MGDLRVIWSPADAYETLRAFVGEQSDTAEVIDLDAHRR